VPHASGQSVADDRILSPMITPITSAPSRLRAGRVEVPLPASFDFEWTRRFLQMRCVPAIEVWSDATYTRSVWIDDGASNEGGRAVTLTMRFVPPVSIDVTASPAIPSKVLHAIVVRLFDLDADLDAFAARVRRDRVLGPLVRRQPELRLPRLLDPFEGLVRAMLGQQVTVRAASTMTDRFVRAFANGESTASLLAFPRPDVVARAGVDRLRAIGLTRAKAAAIVGIAEAISGGRLDCAQLSTLPADEAQAALLALPGVGPWTASYVRMRVLGDRDAFPAADLGVIKALDALGVPRADHVAVAERWRPWRAYATLHLWESLSA
jgi:AraC family transcriptional regulator, regulatory protein of adaptative response / DNA-3-methyladenine glycosylase II